MTKDTKIRVAVTVIGWLLAAIIQAFSFGYFFGSLKQEVKELEKRLDRIEQQQKNTEVKKHELEKNPVVWLRGPRGCNGQQCAGEQRQRGSYPDNRGDGTFARNPDSVEGCPGPVLDAAEPSAGVKPKTGEPRRLCFISYQTRCGRKNLVGAQKTAPVFMRVSRTPGRPDPAGAGAAVVGEN